MAYSTPAEVRQALVPTSDGSLPDPATHTAADLSDAQLTDAISEADTLIDGYLGGRYSVPVLAVNGAIPHPVDYWSRTVAAYLATLTYRGSMDFSDNDPVARRYNAVLSALKDVAAGRMTLQVTMNTGPSAVSGVGPVSNPYVGDLWTPDDFSIGVASSPYPLRGYW